MANDDAKAISDMLENKQIERVTDGQAQIWSETDASLWLLWSGPGFLVQQRAN